MEFASFFPNIKTVIYTSILGNCGVFLHLLNLNGRIRINCVFSCKWEPASALLELQSKHQLLLPMQHPKRDQKALLLSQLQPHTLCQNSEIYIRHTWTCLATSIKKYGFLTFWIVCYHNHLPFHFCHYGAGISKTGTSEFLATA